MWSAPFNFDFYSNCAALALTDTINADERDWFWTMYKNKTIPGCITSKLEKYDENVSEMKIRDDDVEVLATMGTGHQTTLKVIVRPRKEDALPKIVRDRLANNQE